MGMLPKHSNTPTRNEAGDQNTFSLGNNRHVKTGPGIITLAATTMDEESKKSNHVESPKFKSGTAQIESVPYN